MVKYKGPEKLREGILVQCEKLHLLNEENIIVFQDYCEKRTNTIGSGVVIESKGNIYPCAIPDVGCGYHLCRIQGIKRHDIQNNEILLSKLKEAYCGKDKKFSSHKFSVVEMCEKGHQYTKSFFSDNREQKYENVKVSLHKSISELFTTHECSEDLDQYQGHFFEFLEDKNTNIYLLIHSGSWVLADQIMRKYWIPMARESYINGWSTKDNVINGYFKIPIKGTNALFPEYYNDILSLYNFTIAYRDIIEQEITEILKEVFNREVFLHLESDYSHTKLLIDDNNIIHQRGVQYLRGDGETRYIMCGTQSTSSLMFSINKDDYFSHGIPENIEGSDNICFDYTMKRVIKGEKLCPILTIK